MSDKQGQCKKCHRKIEGGHKCHAPQVLQVNSPCEVTTFHSIQRSSKTEFPVTNGAYKNTIVTYADDSSVYLYNSDGIPVSLTPDSIRDFDQLVNRPKYNGKEMTSGTNIVVPEKVSQLENDLDFQTEEGVDNVIREKFGVTVATVDDMKALDAMVGDTINTIGYYSAGDRGAAHYTVRSANDVAADDYVNIAMDNGNVAELSVGSTVDVYQVGAFGDGVRDDYAPIQAAIDILPACTIRFSGGTFIISKPLVAPATDGSKKYFKIDQNSAIKAADSFSGDYLIIIGGSGTPGGYGSTSHKTGISGGTLDCSGKTSGIWSKGTHLADFRNIEILNCTAYGMVVDRVSSTSASSDTYVTNVNVRGVNAGAVGTVGFKIIGHDNNIIMARTSGFHTGIEITGGGNYLTDCHPLYASVASEEDYGSSVAFDIKADDTNLTDCYADNFSIGFQSTAVRWRGNNLFAYWYEHDASHSHIIFKHLSRTFTGLVDGITVSFPEEGNNIGLMIADPAQAEAYYPFIWSTAEGDSVSGHIKNVHMSSVQWGRMADRYGDPILLSDIRDVDSLYMRGVDDSVEAGVYYPILIFPKYAPAVRNNRYASLTVSIGWSLLVEMDIRLDSQDNIVVDNIQTIRNLTGATFTISVARSLGVDGPFVVYIKFSSAVTNNDRIFTTRISPVAGARMIVIPRESIYLSSTEPAITGTDSPSNLINETAPYS